MREYLLTSEYIELNKLLKITGVAQTGGQAGILVSDGQVTVNGLIESRKRAKLRKGDMIVAGEMKIKII